MEHDEFTKKVKDKVTILGAVFCRDKHLETFENLQKAYNALKKAKNNYSYDNFVSLVGKILRMNTYVFSIVWNNAWLIDIKDKYFKQFLKEVEKYLCKYKGHEILEKISKTKEEGGIGLINLTEIIQAIKNLELFNAASQRPESDNMIYEIGIKQMAIYGTNYVGSKAEETNDIIKLLEKNIDEINKTKNPKDIQKIIFPKDKKTYFTEIYDAIKSKLSLLPFRNNRPCYICGKYEDNLDHMLFQCPFLARARNLVKGWLEIAGIDQDNFNRHTLIEMTEVDALQNNVISNYKDIILKKRKLAQRHDVKINEQAIINSLNCNIRFYINHIAKL